MVFFINIYYGLYRSYLRFLGRLFDQQGKIELWRFLYKNIRIEIECSFDSRFSRHLRDISDEEAATILEGFKVFSGYKLFKNTIFIIFQRDVIGFCFYYDKSGQICFIPAEHAYFLLENKRKMHKNLLNKVYYLST